MSFVVFYGLCRGAVRSDVKSSSLAHHIDGLYAIICLIFITLVRCV